MGEILTKDCEGLEIGIGDTVAVNLDGDFDPNKTHDYDPEIDKAPRS